MKLYSENKNYKLYHGSMLDMLEVIEPNSIDVIVTDPPYELNFMNKGWDNSGIAFNKDTWKKCYEVLKPGGYLLAFGGTRTYHRIACTIEDAGFEIRDCIMWLYGSGFPKSMNIGKGLEAKEVYGKAGTTYKRQIEQNCDSEEYTVKQTNNGAMGEIIETTRKEYVAGTDLAKKWQGWGTCLKPAYEPIIVARKPFKGSLVDNVIENGVGGLNIDECRVGNEERFNPKATIGNDGIYNWNTSTNENEQYNGQIVNGRFPANVIHDGSYEVIKDMPITKKGGNITKTYKKTQNTYSQYPDTQIWDSYDDEGSASRYFYCAKASKKDRDEGLDTFNQTTVNDGRQKNIDNAFQRGETLRKNIHPTVKPTELMQYLVRLVSPKGATILDPFNGSGSTGKAVMFENKERNADYKYIGIELTEEYLPIAKARIEFVDKYKEESIIEKQQEEQLEGQLSLFEE